ncbi:hypothetical protein [Leuconostoc palmae]|uniref:hypothetical protein n=1 Tax=Leuconostoc palmae TaxID=501487 RepID=UPI001C7D8242|nr:hypothetical protein [Leuconostoc palmae]
MDDLILKIDSIDEVEEINNIGCYRDFNSEPTINKDMLIHLLSGKPLLDMTDGENVHWLQLDSESIDFVNSILSLKIT